jgi:hypothetical protein
VSGVVLTRDGVVIVQPCGWVCSTLSIVTHSSLSQTSIQTATAFDSDCHSRGKRSENVSEGHKPS